MFSKVSEYLSRLDVKLTVYYTLIIIVLMTAFTGFFIYRLERSLLKQVDKILGDEGNELAQEIRKAADITAGSSIYEQHVANRKHFPIIFRIVTKSGEVAYASKRRGEHITAIPQRGNKKFLHSKYIFEQLSPADL